MQTNHPTIIKQRDKRFLVWCLSTLLSLGSIAFQSEAFAETLDASWVHGNSIHLEQPTAMSINYFGFGGILTLPAANRFTLGGWVHFAIPTPTLENGVRSVLERILISHEGTATIDTIDVWDGPNKIASQPVFVTGDHVDIPTLTVIDLPSNPLIFWGVTISIHVVNNCDGATCPQQYMRFVAAGGDFLN